MTDNRALIRLIEAIGSGHRDAALQMVTATPELAVASLAKGGREAHADEFFFEACAVQIYVGHTALHVAATAYDVEMSRGLIAEGAQVRARNRRGAEPLHAATDGGPGSARWNPAAQAAVIVCLIEAGADVDALAEGGITPLQRAVRNRCSGAVRALLDAGADPNRANKNGSTAFTLAQWTTGRGGSGSAAAKHEQAAIVRMLREAPSRGR